MATFQLKGGAAFIVGEILNALKAIRMALMAPFAVVTTTTGLLRLFGFVGFIVGFFVALSSFCYKLLALISGNLNEFWFDADSNWLSFVGYVLNFDLMYRIFVFYYFVFCGFVISFIITYSLELSSRFIPEAIDVFRVFLKQLTGDD